MKGAVNLVMERLCSRVIRRLSEGVAHSLVAQGTYGSAQSIAVDTTPSQDVVLIASPSSSPSPARILPPSNNNVFSPPPSPPSPASSEAKTDPKGAVEHALKEALEPMLKQMLGGDDGGDEKAQIGKLVRMVMLHLAQCQLEKFSKEKFETVSKIASHYEDALRRRCRSFRRRRRSGSPELLG